MELEWNRVRARVGFTSAIRKLELSAWEEFFLSPTLGYYLRKNKWVLIHAWLPWAAFSCRGLVEPWEVEVEDLEGLFGFRRKIM